MKHAVKLLALGVVLALTACNTMSGVGKDVASVGRTLEDAAN